MNLRFEGVYEGLGYIGANIIFGTQMLNLINYHQLTIVTVGANIKFITRLRDLTNIIAVD